MRRLIIWPGISRRIGACGLTHQGLLRFLKGLRSDQLDGKEDSQVTLTVGGQPRTFRAGAYLYHFAMPNFYFHTTTAYNILRSLGIEIGKRDFMGQMPA